MSHPIVKGLFEEMRRRGLSCGVVGRMSGVNYETIRCWDNGKAITPTLDNLAKVWAALGYEIKIERKG